jgi:hypothetical protein
MTMRFMTIVKGREPITPPPPQALIDAVGRLGEEASKQGVMVGMGGLMPTAMGARARLVGGKITVTDGPFSEAKEVIGGFAIYDVASKQEAIEWTRRLLQLHIEHWKGGEIEVEVRQMYDAPPTGC